MSEIILRNKIYLTGLSADETAAIKNALTLDNPKYAAAKRFSNYGAYSIPPRLFYFTDNRKGQLAVPIGFDVRKYSMITKAADQRITQEAEYPPFILTLRGDQQKAADNYMRLNRYRKLPNGVICLPTGKGKTICALYIAATLRQKTLVIAHKNDLVLAWQKDIELCFGGLVKPGLIKAQTKEIGETITIATVQTLQRLTDEEKKNLFKTFGLVVCDEGHHISASSYALFEYFGALYKMLLTATPERTDGLTPVMFFYAGGFAYLYQNSADDQDILPVEVIVRESNVKLAPCIAPDGKVHNFYTLNLPPSQVKLLEDMEYDARPKISHHEIDDAVMTDESFKKQVIEDICREAGQQRSCIVFLSQKEHCRKYYEALTLELGGTVQLYYGDSKESDEEILKRAESKECLVTISTYSKSTEGTNCKAWEVCFLVSSLNNEKNVEQAVGRIRRTKEGKINPVRAYDYRHPMAYMLKSHGNKRDTRYQKLGFVVHHIR